MRYRWSNWISGWSDIQWIR